MTAPIRTRFAPSPTGVLHIGGARTALYNWLFAKHSGGVFVLRVEDTDMERSTRESIEEIQQALTWLGLAADEGPLFQMDRLDRYRRVGQQLLDAGKAYHCYCSREELAAMREEQKSRGLKPRYDGRCRGRSTSVAGVDPVLRFKNPASGRVQVRDLIHGDVYFDNDELDDLVILRSDHVPTYNFSVVVDDSEMRISHVIRGDDHLNNTPRQINLLTALGLPPPEYAHIPMILGHDGGRLSKRHGAESVMAYKEAGYLPEALLNYLVRLGWSHGDQELFSVSEMIELFDLPRVQKSPASFDPEKLAWVNQEWLGRVSTERLAESLLPYLEARGLTPESASSLAPLVDIQRQRARTLVEMAEKSEFVFAEPSEYAPKAAKQYLGPASQPVLEALSSVLADLPEWTIDATQAAVSEVAARLQLKLGKVAQPLRVALTGDAASPGIGETLFLVGRDSAIRRLRRALDHIGVASGFDSV